MALRVPRHLFSIALILGLLYLFVSNQAAGQTQRGPVALDTTQLKAESLHILGGSRSRVPRWTDSVRFAVVGSADEVTMQQIGSLASQISLYTGLEFRWLQHVFSDARQYQVAVSNSPRYDLALCNGFKKLECANFLIIVSSQSEMHKIARSLPMRAVFQNATAGSEEVACFFSPGVNAAFEIKRSVVFVNSNLEQDMLHTCLQEEMLQSFGLFNDYSDSRFYSFNNVVAVKKLTTYDKILLSSLYDRSHPTGAMASVIAQSVVDYCQAVCWEPDRE